MAKIYKIIFFSLLFCLTLLSVKPVNAATFFFSPNSGNYNIGKTISVSVYVSSADKAVNAVSGALSFPEDKLEVTSLSKSNSIISFWVQEPSFSNSTGVVNFEGVKFNPGFTGSSGKVITINFKVKAAGSAIINFSSAAILANDGKGTNILTGSGSAKFSLEDPAKVIPKIEKPSTPTVPTTPVVSVTTKETVSPTSLNRPAASQITSVTHPDSNKWYAEKDAKFIWNLAPGVTAVRLLVDKNSDTTPSVTYFPAISEKEIVGLEDGVWYFHVQSQNNNGWGEVSHFKFQIDTLPPEQFTIKFVDGNKTENPTPTIVFNTTDSLSGVKYYKIKIGEGEFFSVEPETIKDNQYTLPPQNIGKRNILIYAVDNAENYSVATEEFIIEPLLAPIITEYPKQLSSGDVLIIKGTTQYPNAQTEIWLEKDGEEAASQSVKNNANGNFTLVIEEKLADGIYKIWAEVSDARGAKSNSSEKVTIAVAQPVISRVGDKVSNFLAVVVPLALLIVALLLIIWYGWKKYLLLKKRFQVEAYKIEILKAKINSSSSPKLISTTNKHIRKQTPVKKLQ